MRQRVDLCQMASLVTDCHAETWWTVAALSLAFASIANVGDALFFNCGQVSKRVVLLFDLTITCDDTIPNLTTSMANTSFGVPSVS